MKLKSPFTFLFLFAILLKVNLVFGQYNLDWTTFYNAPSYLDQTATDLLLDDGFIYVAGSSAEDPSLLTNPDFLLIKMTSLGDTVWVKRTYDYEKPSSIGDGTQIMVNDDSSNIYVTGGFALPSFDYLLMKYNSLGDTLWTRKYNGSQNSWDYAKAIAIDSNGDIIITGMSNNGGTNGDCVTIKYDSNGNQLWMKSFDSGNSLWDDYGYKIAIDDSNNVFVAGNFGLIKYNSTGLFQWSNLNASFSQSGEGVNVKVDTESNLIYTSRNSNNQIAKYDQLGNLLWSTNFSPTGYTIDNRVYDLTVDVSNNIIVTGGAYNGNAWDIATIKYNDSLNLDWEKVSIGSSPNYITSDILNNVYIAAENFSLLKYDSLGALIWDSNYAANFSNARKLALDSNNAIYMTGDIYNSATFSSEILTLKYSTPTIISSLKNIQFKENPYPITIYPNPFSSETAIQIENILENVTLKVYNSIGKKVRELSYVPGQVTTLTRDNLPDGIYFIQLSVANEIISASKVIIAN